MRVVIYMIFSANMIKERLDALQDIVRFCTSLFRCLLLKLFASAFQDLCNLCKIFLLLQIYQTGQCMTMGCPVSLEFCSDGEGLTHPCLSTH